MDLVHLTKTETSVLCMLSQLNNIFYIHVIRAMFYNTVIDIMNMQ